MYIKRIPMNDTKKQSYCAPTGACIDINRWVVPIAKPLPTYPLEPHAILVNEDAQTVASRIDECTRIRSVQVTFDNDKVQATCTTASFLKYFVTLYKLGKQTGTIVNVQRRKGCPLEFANERRAIINAARGYKDETTSNQRQIPVALNESSTSRPNDKYLKEILKELAGKFHDSFKDDQLLRLHRLAIMTDSDKSGSETSSQIAKMILLDGDTEICQIIGSILTSRSLDEEGIQMRHYCLTIVSNALDILSQNKRILFHDPSKEKWFVRVLFPCLIDDVRSCRCLHNAYLSLKCLRLLLRCCPAVRRKAANCELMTILENTLLLAKRNHAKLEKEAEVTTRIIYSLIYHQ